MKSPRHADPSSNPITANIYGLPDLVQRKDKCSLGQWVKLCNMSDTKKLMLTKSPFYFSIGWTFTENDDQGAIWPGSQLDPPTLKTVLKLDCFGNCVPCESETAACVMRILTLELYVSLHGNKRPYWNHFASVVCECRGRRKYINHRRNVWLAHGNSPYLKKSFFFHFVFWEEGLICL